jgi:thiamine biosynthesis lipoprotein
MPPDPPRPPLPSRRRALAILGGAASLIAWRAGAAPPPRRCEWRGTALGADARLVLYAHAEAHAERAAAAAVAEIERLEREFSLYRPDSALCRLNRDGVLAAPSPDMLALLREAVRWGDATGGAFDVTVQPLWELHARHFAGRPDDADGPPAAAIARARALVDYRRIELTAERISLAANTAVTLNGIAQGYVTDRVADLLRGLGWSDVLIDLGEQRALGRPADRRPWTVAIADPNDRAASLAQVPLEHSAMATSAGAGTVLDRHGRHHHLFEPATGRSAPYWRSVTVIADRATAADALSTAAAVLPPPRAFEVLRRAGVSRAWLFDPGRWLHRIDGDSVTSVRI